MSLVPFTAKDCVVCIYYYYVKRQVVNPILHNFKVTKQQNSGVSFVF